MCSARAHSKWSLLKCPQVSSLLLKFTPQVYPPPFETVIDGWSISRPIAESMCSVRTHLKWSLLKFTPQVSSPHISSLLLKFTPQVYPPPFWNCHWQQITYWLINVCSENPFKTVIFKTALHCVIWCWASGEVSHTFITYKNEAIYVNFKFLFLFLLCLWFHVVVVCA